MEFQLSSFKSWKMMLWKCCTQYASKFGKLSSGHRTGKGQFSFQSQRKGMPKNAQTTVQLHSSHSLAKQCSKFSKPGFNNTWTVNFQLFKLVLEKAEEPEIKCQHLLDHQKSKRVPEKHLFLLYGVCQSLWLCGSQETVENSERDWNARPPDLPLDKPVCRSGSKLELDIEQQTGSKYGKEYVKAVYCHPHSIYMWSISWETLGWMKHKLE